MTILIAQQAEWARATETKKTLINGRYTSSRRSPPRPPIIRGAVSSAIGRDDAIEPGDFASNSVAQDEPRGAFLHRAGCV